MNREEFYEKTRGNAWLEFTGTKKTILEFFDVWFDEREQEVITKYLEKGIEFAKIKGEDEKFRAFFKKYGEGCYLNGPTDMSAEMNKRIEAWKAIQDLKKVARSEGG